MDNSIINTLKFLPAGTKLYSPIYGECSLNSANNTINVSYHTGNNVTTAIFFPDGRKTTNGEVMLFPGKDMYWEDYLLIKHTAGMTEFYRYPLKNGDYIEFKYKGRKYFAIYKNLTFNTLRYHVLIDADTKEKTFNSYLYLTENNKLTISLIHSVSNIRISSIDMYLGYSNKKFDKETKSIIDIKSTTDNSPKYQFKPFDKVLVRDTCDDTWRASFFSHIEEDSSRYVTTGLTWKYCIPYKGNESLLNTTNPV